MTNESGNEVDEVLQLSSSDRPGPKAWSRACIRLLALLDGIERYMDDEVDHPHRELRQYLQRALSRNEPLDLTRLQLFEYRAMSKQTLEMWQPLAESFQRFQERHAGRIRVWKDFSAYPNPATIANWLANHVSSSNECQALLDDRLPSETLRDR